MPVISSTRWRILISATHASGNCSIGEVEMASVAAGANLCTGGTPSASSVYAPDPVNYAASKSFDGLLTTRWNNNASELPSWLEYQFAGAVAILEYRVKAPTDYAGGMPSAWQFQYWDGSTWVTLDTRSGIAAWSLSESRTYGFSTDPSASVRVTQDVIEILSQPNPTVRVSQDVIEVLSLPNPSARVTQYVVEILSEYNSPFTEQTQFFVIMP